MADNTGFAVQRTVQGQASALNHKLPRQQTKGRSHQPRLLVYTLMPITFLLISLYFQHDHSLGDENIGGACRGYKGILHIAQGDVEGAAGTIFFLFVLNQLAYAEKHALMPWVHLNDISQYVYDPLVHGQGNTISFDVPTIVNASWTAFIDPITKEEVAFAGPPLEADMSASRKSKVAVAGTGVWSSYFYPVSRFSPSDRSCTNLPLVRLTHGQIIPALHINCPWSVRAWRYRGLPPSIRQKHLSYNEWFAPMRERGSYLFERYVRLLPYLHQLARKANPSEKCLALHIRHSDKANKRRKIRVNAFLPYVEAFLEEQERTNKDENYSVFLATDSHNVIRMIEETWPSKILHRIRWQQQVVRSNDSTPVFTLSSHHATNIEVLVDIIAMSKCQFLLHGLSAVSEAVHYVNSDLNNKNQSVNLEISNHASVSEFQSMIMHTTSA